MLKQRLLLPFMLVPLLTASCSGHHSSGKKPGPRVEQNKDSAKDEKLESPGPLRDARQLPQRVGEFPRVKLAICDAVDGNRSSGECYHHSYTDPRYYDQLRDSLPVGWRQLGDEQGTWLLEKDGSQVGIVRHETGLELVLVGLTVGAAVAIVAKLWPAHQDAVSQNRYVTDKQHVVIVRCADGLAELSLRVPPDAGQELARFVEQSLGVCVMSQSLKKSP